MAVNLVFGKWAACAIVQVRFVATFSEIFLCYSIIESICILSRVLTHCPSVFTTQSNEERTDGRVF
jgi:hypothetical protein